MARTVAVELLAKVTNYKRGMGEAKKSTEGVDDAITSVGTNKGLDAAAEKARGFGTATSEAKARARADFAEIVKHAGELDRQIALTQRNLGALAKGFANSGGGDKRIADEIRVQQRQLSQLRNVRKMLPDPAEIMKAGQSMGTQLVGGIGSSMRSALPGAMSSATAAVPVVAVAAPMVAGLVTFLGTVMAGAILGGAGVGGVIGGLAIAGRDQRVQAAAKNLAEHVAGQLEQMALPFLRETLNAITLIEQRFNRMTTDLDPIFAQAATYVRPLVEGLLGLVERALPGIRAGVIAAQPIITVLSEQLPRLGEKIGGIFQAVADNGPAAALAVRQLFGMIAAGVEIVGGVINALTEVFSIAARLGLMGNEAQLQILSLEAAQKASAGASKQASGGMDTFRRVIKEAGTETAGSTTKLVDFNHELELLAAKNISAAEATIALRAAAKSAGEAIDKKRGVTDAEHTALIGFARAANTATKTLDEQGRTVKEATAAHEANRKKLIETAIKMGASRTEAKRLADQYLAIPKNVNTKTNQPNMPGAQKQLKVYDKMIRDTAAKFINTRIEVKGDVEARARLKGLLIAQQALSKGIPVSAARSAFNKNEAKFHDGGYTGNGPTRAPAGIVHGKEWVINAASSDKIERKHPGLLNEMNATGQVPGYWSGGRVLNAPFPVNVAGMKILSRAEALSRVTPAFGGGGWPSSPSAVRGDSGRWRRIRAYLENAHLGGSFGNGYRPGDPKWHGSGWAVDWMGFGQDRLASRLAALKPLELIHRTKNRDYAYTRGRNKGSFNNALMQAHRNHIHIAMGNGGVIGEHVVGVGKSGASYEFGENGPERVLSTAQTMGGAGGATYITIAPQLTPNMHPREVGKQIAEYLTPYLAAGGQINVRGKPVLAAS